MLKIDHTFFTVVIIGFRTVRRFSAMYSLGLDIGYSAIKFVLVNERFEIVNNTYRLHRGKIKEELEHYLEELISRYGQENIIFGAATGQGSKLFSENQGIHWINEITALSEGSWRINPEIKSVMEIGGQSSKYLTHMDQADKSALVISINSNCAAGTGAFLEEQVSRLGLRLEDYAAHTKKARLVPRIAGRCSVFAKTDIIHHQQEGTEVKEILLGLAYALARNYRSNVVKKHPILKPVLFTGGVAYNEAIRGALMDIFKLAPDEIIVPEYCGNVAALGAAIIGMKDRLPLDYAKLERGMEQGGQKADLTREATEFSPLDQFGKNDSLNKHVCKPLEGTAPINAYLGLDIGSTSTNVVLIDEDNQVIGWKYLRTLGDPLGAVRKGLAELSEELSTKLGSEFNKELSHGIHVLGAGATGSGRSMAGRYVGADVVIDEITAQAKAAWFLDPEVETIIEIGGQDSKFITLKNGVVSDFEMNKICAAGTGSFIEEQAKKLNIPIGEFGDLAMGSRNPRDLGERCTVFIETNIAAALSEETKLEDIAAGLSYSIVKNYLNKVAGSREIGKKVFFQGGVAHNQAVVNAFRSVLGNRLEVPPYFSVTGAYGVALLAKEQRKESDSSFKGFALEAGTDFKETHQQEQNKESAPTQIFKKTEEYYLEGYEKDLDPAKQTVGIPRVLFLHKLFPLFHTFFKELGFNVLLSDNSTERTVELSQEFAMEETCYPIKLINGHVAQLIEKKVDYIFLPSLHTMAHPISQTRQNYGCVYMQCFPKLIRQTMDLDSKGIKLLSPALSFEFGKTYMMKTLIKLGVSLNKNPIRTALALKKGMGSLNCFEQNVERLGDETIKGLSKDEKVFVIVTRAYGIADPILSMGIPEKIEKLGYKVLTLSNLPAHQHDTAKEYPNMYWPFGQHILSGAQIIKQHPNLYVIYLTNHGCGPDTALTHFFKEEMKGKPYLNIEVDEHFSSVGVLTRVEAFINSLSSEKVSPQDNSWELKHYSEAVVHKAVNIQSEFAELDQETLWHLPHLYPYSHLLASYLQSKGYKAQVLPMTTEKTLNLGRKYTLTKEYLSFSGLVGDVLSKALELKESHEAFGFIIPTSEGSEVGGQYHRLIRDKLDGENLNQVKIFAPYPEDVLKDAEMAPELILLLLAGDIINLAPRKEREKYLQRIQSYIVGGRLQMKNLWDIAEEVRQELQDIQGEKKILVVGEVKVLFNDFLNNHTFKALEEQGIRVLYAPLSETLWLGWRDYLSQKKHKSESTAHNQLKSLTEGIKSIAELFTGVNPFEHNRVELAQRADRELGLYSGGDGRYRQAKVLGTFKE